MVQSAGLVLIHNNKILLVHPTGAKWQGTYSFPKGEIQEGETPLDAAVRETFEEIGATWHDKIPILDDGYINYTNNGRDTYKRVHYFVVELPNGLDPSMCTLQKEEVDWVGWLTKEEAEKKIFWRLLSVLKYLK